MLLRKYLEELFPRLVVPYVPSVTSLGLLLRPCTDGPLSSEGQALEVHKRDSLTVRGCEDEI